MKKNYLLFCGLALLTVRPAAAQYQPVPFNASTPESLPLTATGLPLFSSSLLSVLGSVDYAGSPATLTGTTVIGGDLRLRAGSTLTVAATGKLYVYGNSYIEAGSLIIEPKGEVFLYGNQFGITPSPGTTHVTGGGTLALISPRPAPGQTADGQQRPTAPDGLRGGSSPRYMDGGGLRFDLNLEHRAASGLTLLDFNSDGMAGLSLSGELRLLADNAPLTLAGHSLLIDQSLMGPGATQGSITGYSPLRYVQTDGLGQLQIGGLPAGKDFTFPLGHGASGDYTPVRVVNRHPAAVTLAARVTSAAPPLPLKASVGRFWLLSANEPAAPFDLTLEHNLSTNEAGYNDAAASVVRYEAGSWSSPAGARAGTSPGLLSTSGPVAAASDLDMLATTASSTTYFTKITASAPLPVTLVDFTATRRPGATTVTLAWKTASELNNAGFGIERSLDGGTWQPLAFIPGNGTSSISHTYSQATPYVGAAYYRLQQQDFNGQREYSTVRYIGPDKVLAAFYVFPSPSTGKLNVSGAEAGKPIQVINMLGQVVTTLPAGQVTADLTGQLPTGVYLVRQGPRQARFIIE